MEGTKDHSALYDDDDVDRSIYNLINNVTEEADENAMSDDVVDVERQRYEDEHQNGDVVKPSDVILKVEETRFEDDEVDKALFNKIDNVIESVDQLTQKIDTLCDDVMNINKPSYDVIKVQRSKAEVTKVEQVTRVMKVEETSDDVKKTEKMTNDVMNFNLLISGIEANDCIDSKHRKSFWVDHFEQAKNDSKWTDNALKCFVHKDQSRYVNLTFKDVYSLVCEYGWLSDSVITAVINNKTKDGDCGFIEVSVLKALENPHFSGNTPTPFKEKDGYIAVKNVNKNHWIFVYLSLNEQTMYVFDPMSKAVPPCSEQLLDAFKTNHHNEKNSEEASKWNFKSGEWKVKTFYHSLQNDLHSCGVFCLEYASQISSMFPYIPDELVVHNEPEVSRQLFVDSLLASTGLYVKGDDSVSELVNRKVHAFENGYESDSEEDSDSEYIGSSESEESE